MPFKKRIRKFFFQDETDNEASGASHDSSNMERLETVSPGNVPRATPPSLTSADMSGISTYRPDREGAFTVSESDTQAPIVEQSSEASASNRARSEEPVVRTARSSSKIADRVAGIRRSVEIGKEGKGKKSKKKFGRKAKLLDGSKTTPSDEDYERTRPNSLLPSNLIFETADYAEVAEEEDDDEEEVLSDDEIEEKMGKPVDDITTYFNDGVRKIDFVLAYFRSEENTDRVKKMDVLRNHFLSSCNILGIETEIENVLYSTGRLHFIKVHAPWNLLASTAEAIRLKVPIRYHKPLRTETWGGRLCKKFHLKNICAQDIPYLAASFYSARFYQRDFNRYIGSENKRTFFTTTQRIRMVHMILSSVVYGDTRAGEVGYQQLLEAGAFQAAYALHDGDFLPEWDGFMPKFPLNRRQILYAYWAQFGLWYKDQPLHHIREYFGEKIAMYFAMIELYTAWLVPFAICGSLVFTYGIITVWSNPVVKQVCASKGQYTMCPRCDTCSYWDYSEICNLAKASHVFGNIVSIFFGIFASLWAVTFLEFWKRQSATLAYQWDCWDLELDEEFMRPEFAAKAPHVKRNPVTGKTEPSFPENIHVKRRIITVLGLLLMVGVVIVFLIAIIIFKVFVSIRLSKDANLSYGKAHQIIVTIGCVLNFLLILFMSKIYSFLAIKLTKWEMHRSDTGFENSLIGKLFMFEFVNYFASIFYVAFFKGTFIGYPGHYIRIFGERNEECNLGGCLLELMMLVGMILIGKQSSISMKEVLIPKIMIWWRKRKGFVEEQKYDTQWQKDFFLQSNPDLISDYLQVVWQFGFITLFVSSFPLAPVIALIANYIEIRVDADRYLCHARRLPPEQAKDIGIWFDILDFEARLSVITSAFSLAFTTNVLSEILYKYEHSNFDSFLNHTLAVSAEGAFDQRCRYEGFRNEDGSLTSISWELITVKLGFVLLYEHLVFFTCRVINIMVPDVPSDVEIKIKRQQYLARKLLQEKAGKRAFVSRKRPSSVESNLGENKMEEI